MYVLNLGVKGLTHPAFASVAEWPGFRPPLCLSIFIHHLRGAAGGLLERQRHSNHTGRTEDVYVRGYVPHEESFHVEMQCKSMFILQMNV